RLANPAESNPPSPESFRLTSSEDLRGFLERHCQPALGHRAASRLLLSYPEFSNAPGEDIRRSTKFTVNVICVLAFCIAAPVAVVEMLSGILCALFVAAGFLRLLSPWYGRHGSPDTGSHDDKSLPVYTVICALYREAGIVGNLIEAIRAIDYPPEKLDVKIVLEEDDLDTRRALARLRLGPPFEIMTAPAVGPRTKPKALNVALPFARGPYTVVFDAEDEPEPDQLRRAVAMFRADRH